MSATGQAFTDRMQTLATEITEAWFVTNTNDPEEMRKFAHKILEANLAHLFKSSFADEAKKHAIHLVGERIFREWLENDTTHSIAESTQVRAALDTVMTFEDIAQEVRTKGLQQRIRIWRMYANGYSQKEIAKREQISTEKVREFLQLARTRREFLRAELKLYDERMNLT